jgi:hypothetical protein
MTNSRQRFEAWAKDRPREFDLDIQTDMGAWPGQYDDYNVQCAWEAWQAAEAEAARHCVDHINGLSIIGDRSAQMIEGIKAEFPGAWK